MLKTRVKSVDLLRGLTITAMILVNNPGSWSHIYAPLRHAEWHGLTPTDLIFPFFLFIVGISIYYAYKSKPNAWATYKKIIIRSLKLIGLGLFLNAFLPYVPFFTDLDTVRIPGVLQRIGIVFCFAALLYLNCSWLKLTLIGASVLILYYLCLGFIPFQDGTLATFDRAPNNWANCIDLKLLGKHMWQSDYDPEGLVSTFPALVTCISGILIARVLDGLQKISHLFFIAFGLIVSGCVFNYWFPINKAIWSSSFVLVTSGIATLLLAILYYFQDLRNWQFGSVFTYAGMNAITIYFVSSLVAKSMYLIPVNSQDNVHSYLYSALLDSTAMSDKFTSLVYALVVVVFYLIMGYVLYKKKIFIKI